MNALLRRSRFPSDQARHWRRPVRLAAALAIAVTAGVVGLATTPAGVAADAAAGRFPPQALHLPAGSPPPLVAAAPSPPHPPAADRADSHGVVRRRSDRAAAGSQVSHDPPRAATSPLTARDAALAVLFFSVFIVCIVVMRRQLGAPMPRAAHHAVEVLSRTPLSPRQSLVLVRLGRSVLLVGASADRLNVLAQVSEPVAAAEILGGAAAARASSHSAAFADFLRSQDGGATDERRPVLPINQAATGAISRVRNELRRLSEAVRAQGPRSHGIPPDPAHRPA